MFDFDFGRIFSSRPSESIATSVVRAVYTATTSSVPSSTPSFTPSYTPSYTASYTPPSYTPSTPSYTSSFISRRSSDYIPTHTPFVPSPSEGIGVQIAKEIFGVATNGGIMEDLEFPTPDCKYPLSVTISRNTKDTSSSSSSSSSVYTSSSTSSSNSQSKSKSNEDSSTDQKKSAGFTDNETIFENNTPYDIEFECEDREIGNGSIRVSAGEKRSVLIYTKFRAGLHPKFAMRVFWSGSLLLEERNFRPTPNEVNYVFDNKITSKPLKRKDNPCSRHFEIRTVQKFKIPISEAVRNFEEKQKKTQINQKIKSIREKLAILQQIFDKLQYLDIPKNLTHRYEKIIEKITNLLELNYKSDEDLGELPQENINRISEVTAQAQALINEVNDTNWKLAKKMEEAEIAGPIRTDLGKLDKILQELESESRHIELTSDLRISISSAVREARELLVFKDKSNSKLTKNVGGRVENSLEKINSALGLIQREKRIFQEKICEQKRVEKIRENLQTLTAIMRKPEFKTSATAGISKNLLAERASLIEIATKQLALHSKPDSHLTPRVGEDVQQAIDRGNQFSHKWTLELKSIKELERLQLAQKQQQINELQINLNNLKMSIQESQLSPQVKIQFLNHISQFNARLNSVDTQFNWQNFEQKGQALVREIKNQITLSVPTMAESGGSRLFKPYSSRDDVRSPTGSDKNDFDEEDQSVVIISR